MQFRFKRALYEKRALLTAAYKFTDRAYIHLDMDDTDYIVDVEMKPECENIRPELFQNEILAAMVRMDVHKRTKNVRELLLARALASTVVTPIDEEYEEEDSVDLETGTKEEVSEDIDDILTDWFEKYK